MGIGEAGGGVLVDVKGDFLVLADMGSSLQVNGYLCYLLRLYVHRNQIIYRGRKSFGLVGWGGIQVTLHCHRQTDSAFRWAAERAILIYH